MNIEQLPFEYFTNKLDSTFWIFLNAVIAFLRVFRFIEGIN